MAVIIDVEASGLHPASYPIEIAWYDFETQESDSFLVKPTSYWTYWDPEAEGIHGIKQEKLLMEGISVFEASDRLVEGLKGRKVYSDAVQFDAMWIDTLLEASGESEVIPFGSVYELVPEHKYAVFGEKLSLSERPHRALDDCLIIAECVQQSQ